MHFKSYSEKWQENFIHGFERAGSDLQIEGKYLVCSSASRSVYRQQADLLQDFIQFHLKIFTIDSCSNSIFK